MNIKKYNSILRPELNMSFLTPKYRDNTVIIIELLLILNFYRNHLIKFEIGKIILGCL